MLINVGNRWDCELDQENTELHHTLESSQNIFNDWAVQVSSCGEDKRIE